MKLAEFRVDNFKSAAGVKLELAGMTALVGVNGSGKSTLLEALYHFFRDPDIPGDSYRDPAKPITMSAMFAQVPKQPKPVTIKKVWVSPGEEPTMSASAKGKVSTPQKIMDSVHVIFERAEHETDNDGTSQSGLDLVRLIKDTINEELAKVNRAELFSQHNEYYSSLRNNIAEFQTLMNQKLSGDSVNSLGYAQGSATDFAIVAPDPEPSITATLMEHGMSIPHKLAGHGTKRAYHMAALETYAEMSSKREGGKLVLMLVDEPELHQHPQRQRHILQTYKRLSEQPSFQVVYSTHSPEMIDLEGLEGIYRISRDGENRMAAKSGSGLEDMSHWSVSKCLASGIFSRGAILVEGWRDEVILNEAFSLVEIEGKSALKRLVEKDIHFITTDGAQHMPDFVKFFRELEMPMFVIWDADTHDSNKKQNKDILAALGGGTTFDANPASFAYNLFDDHMCFANDSGMYFKEYLGFGDAPDTPETKKEIKRAIIDDPGMVSRIRGGFPGSEFAVSVVPHIDRFFSGLA